MPIPLLTGAVVVGGLIGLYLGVLAFFVACEVFCMCKAYEGHQGCKRL